ncbi:hypothetical protein HOLleu_25234 [Holothuria leucospilota]|uniref:Uncharacterized protein n=1 Tax=Holothuria leucospilota TaxID=206669 RepID=A0A9Q1BSI7_HOLLE|nr:hypothetical protein HOLleu_25234 [Holothuria leucospilota]
MDWTFTAVIVVALCVPHVVGELSKQLCESPQFLELGKLGIIGCSFHEGYFGIFWYNTTNYREDLPILTYKESAKSGVGFLSGEYDVFENGSLVIKEVSLRHETSFTIAYLASREEYTETSIIDVFVIERHGDYDYYDNDDDTDDDDYDDDDYNDYDDNDDDAHEEIDSNEDDNKLR